MSTNGTDYVAPKWAPAPFDYDTFIDFEIGLTVIIMAALSLFGIVSNIINLIIFYQQGIMAHSCNVCLATISFSDLLYSMFKIWGATCKGIIEFVDGWKYKFPWYVWQFYIRTAYTPGQCLMIFTSGITVFVTFERCFSVVFPFKVKTFFTPMRTSFALVMIFVITILTKVPLLFSATLKWVDYPQYNMSSLKFKHYIILPTFFWTLHTHVPRYLPITSIIIVILCNGVIAWKVIFSNKFRKTSAPKTTATKIGDNTTAKEKTSASSKENKLVRLITVTSIFYVICYGYQYFNNLVLNNILVIYVDYHWYTLEVAYMFEEVITSTNASFNIFIYYKMSTTYREIFQRLFRLGTK